MPSSLPVTRLVRRPDRGWLGGVAAGIAEHTGLPVRRVRVLFAALTMAGGLGLALYATYWIVLPAPEGARRARMPRALEVGLFVVVVAGAAAILSTRFGFAGLFLPTLLSCLGGAVIWRQATVPDRELMLRRSRTSLGAPASDRMGRARLVLGTVLVLAGAAIVLRRADVSAVGDGLLAMVVTIVGLVLVTGPWWIKLMGQLGAERSERIRSQERADIAAHLHDSVLQTLALIQRNAESPREVARLARGQERELRGLLYGTRPTGGTLADELRRAAAEVEDAYAIQVDVVVVGDVPLDDALAAACAAAREAMVNAARHSGAAAASVYAEVEDDAISVFVKDRGVGFDPDQIAGDRQGVRGSIVARVERHGGEVTIRSTKGTGTEVAIRMKR